MPTAKDILAVWEAALAQEEGVALRRFRGQWQLGAEYQPGDVMSYARGVYVAASAFRAEMPPHSPDSAGLYAVVIPSHFGASRGEPGERGPRGLVGDSGGSPTIELAVDVQENNVIGLDANGRGILADHRNNTAMTAHGIAAQAGTAGETIPLRIVPTTWGGVPLLVGQSLFLGQVGQLVTTPPSTGWLRQIAVATGPSTIIVDIGMAYSVGS
jgi:hypothetical protein